MSGHPHKTFIAIAGNIGAGKSSLVDFLARSYDIQPFYEPNDDNPYLNDFYEDMPRWAFHSQLYFLSSKFRMHQQMDHSTGVVVLDRTIFEDAEIFAAAHHQLGNIDSRDWATYRNFYQTIIETLRPPDLMIYLRCPVRTLRQRIRLRGRPMEQDISLAYLRRLNELYEQWIARLDDVVILDSDRLNFVDDMIDCLDVRTRIEALLPETVLRRC